jgi:hypothetical protein
MPQAYKLPLHYRFNDRLSYFSELIVSRKFTTWLSLRAGVSFSHYNAVGTAYDHDKVGAHCAGRIKVSPQGSIIFNYDEPLKINFGVRNLMAKNKPEQVNFPNLG